MYTHKEKMASDDDDLGDLRAKIDRKAENAWFGKYRSFGVTFGTFENLRKVVRVDDAGGVKNPTRNLKEKKESPLLKLFQDPDFIDIFFTKNMKRDSPNVGQRTTFSRTSASGRALCSIRRTRSCSRAPAKRFGRSCWSTRRQRIS